MMLAMPCGAGSGEPPVRAMSARVRRSFLTFHLRPARCCSRKQGLTLLAPSPSRPPTRPCYFAGCAWPSHSLRDPAAVGVGWTPLAITGPLAPRRGSSPARAAPLERAVAGGGARVARNVRVADMNIDVPVADDRRIEVVANGLPLWHGAQLALDATLVSLLTRAGEPRAGVEPCHCVAAAARRKRQGTHPELQRARRCRLVVIGLEVGGRFGAEAATFLRLLAHHWTATVPAHLRPAARAAWISAGLRCSQWRRSAPSPAPSLSCPWRARPTATTASPSFMSSSLTGAGNGRSPQAASLPADSPPSDPPKLLMLDLLQ